MTYKTVTLKRGKEESLQRFHPWVFSGAIAAADDTIEEGDLVTVYAHDGTLIGNGHSQIGSIFPPTWNWMAFWELTAFISVILAVMNVLPIPALDGGHVMFLLYEIITRRKPSLKFMERAQTIGMIILIALLLFANGNDIYRFFFK